MVPHEGVSLTLAGREFIVPALTFRQLKTLLPRLNRLQAAAGGALEAEHLDIVTDLVEAALTRNYPELSREEIEERLTFAAMPRAIAAVLLGSGLTQATPPGMGDTPPGE
jgi:hypothetical protein